MHTGDWFQAQVTSCPRGADPAGGRAELPLPRGAHPRWSAARPARAPPGKAAPGAARTAAPGTAPGLRAPHSSHRVPPGSPPGPRPTAGSTAASPCGSRRGPGSLARSPRGSGGERRFPPHPAEPSWTPRGPGAAGSSGRPGAAWLPHQTPGLGRGSSLGRVVQGGGQRFPPPAANDISRNCFPSSLASPHPPPGRAGTGVRRGRSRACNGECAIKTAREGVAERRWGGEGERGVQEGWGWATGVQPEVPEVGEHKVLLGGGGRAGRAEGQVQVTPPAKHHTHLPDPP